MTDTEKPIVCVVEGRGDEESIPIILRRLAEEQGVYTLKIHHPFRVQRTRLVRPGELERTVEAAARKLGGHGGIVIVLDADDDLVCELGPSLLQRATSARPDVPCISVLANREKEAWFLASIRSLAGKRGIPEDVSAIDDVEQIRGAKEVLSKLMGRRFSEVIDQAKMSAQFDLKQARKGSVSFRKLSRDFTRLLGEIPTSD
jgi:hypothetical protein